MNQKKKKKPQKMKGKKLPFYLICSIMGCLKFLIIKDNIDSRTIGFFPLLNLIIF